MMGDEGVLSNKKVIFEVRVRQYATGKTGGTLEIQTKRLERGQGGKVAGHSGTEDQNIGGGSIVRAGNLPDGWYEDADGNPGTYGPTPTESKRDRAIEATWT